VAQNQRFEGWQPDRGLNGRFDGLIAGRGGAPQFPRAVVVAGGCVRIAPPQSWAPRARFRPV